MSSQPGADAPARVALSEHLQAVTEALATTRTPEEVSGVILTTALAALNARAGAVLLVDATGTRLEIAATQGDEAGARILRQEGPLTGNVPAGDALNRRELLFFEREGDLVRADPEVEARTGGKAAVAALPLLIGDQPLGTLILDFGASHEVTPEEVRFLRTLAAQGALALSRAQLAADLQQVRERTGPGEAHAQGQEAFVAFTEAVGTETDLLALARQAIAVLRARFQDGSIGYYTKGGDLWTAQAWSEDMGEALVHRLRAGLPDRTPLIRRGLQTGTAVFTDAWDPEREGIEHSGDYGSAAIYPLVVNGEVRHLLLIGLKDTRRWRERDRALVRAVGRSLNLALERAEQARQLQARTDEEARRTQTLAAFAELSRDLVLETDPLAIMRRTQEVVLGLLPPGFSLYYEPGGGWWHLRSQVGQASTPELQAAVEAGFAFEVGTNMLIPYQSGEPHYQDEYDPGTDQLSGSDGYPGATAVLPVIVNGQSRGVVGFALYTGRRWSAEDRAVLETVGRQLTLALERAEQTRRLAAQNAELEARTRALSAFEEWTRDLTLDSEPAALIQRAEELLLDLLPVQAALYYERDGERWYVRSMRGEYGSEGLRLAHEAGLPHDETDNLRLPSLTGETYYQGAYNPATDGLADHMTHVSATAIVPLRTGQGIRGLIGLGRFGQANWTDAERAIIESVRRSLELALDRANRLAELDQERAALSARTTELAAANEELEAFTYSVSHDLRTPVRHVMSFNDLLRRHLGEHLDAKAARYLQVVGESAGRMNTLIDAMLDLSRTSRLPLRLGPVDLNELVRTVRTELEADTLDRRVQWEVGPLPLVTADHDTLRQVVVNLLENALKYTRPREVARIEVWAEAQPGEWVVLVRDNGVGFDPQYGNKLFGVFQRLHLAKDFEGTGVGLANVRRIIARHRGWVWAEGRPGEGATFSFTLPRG
ncbi:GAF domain-containing protein [Deinococcus planocerae]|uniref:GAF domain-containing protein n=1 Tax=Deinococcus planocerae TaxID=1737569 RepID=UPI000C7EF127|nr:GAF domain-containing protein [Deinococcus planocerae]